MEFRPREAKGAVEKGVWMGLETWAEGRGVAKVAETAVE